MHSADVIVLGLGPAGASAAAEAARRGVALVVLHSMDVGPVTAMRAGGAYPMIPPIGALEDLRVRVRAEALDRLRRGLESVGAKGETIVADDAPGDAIVAAARTLPAELVVVGTIGRTGLSRLALGSVAEAVVRSAPCSVLVMRLHRSWPDPDRRSLRNALP